MPNSYSMASSSIVSQQWKGQATTSEATGKKNALEKYDWFYIINYIKATHKDSKYIWDSNETT